MTKQRRPLTGMALHRAYTKADARIARDRNLSKTERALARRYFRELVVALF
jgi:hypothetical protein